MALLPWGQNFWGTWALEWPLPDPLGLRNLSCSHGSGCFLLPRPVVPDTALMINRC